MRGKRKRVEETSAPVPAEGIMEVKMSGTPDQIRDHLGMDTQPENGGVAVQAPPVEDDFTLALRSSTSVIIVKRISPRHVDGVPINVEVYRQEGPLGLQDIQDEVFQNHGGRKFRVAVVDSESGKVIAARVIENDTDPILPQRAVSSEEAQRKFLAEIQEEEPSANAMNLEALENQSKRTAKLIEQEQLDQQLEAIRARKGVKGDTSSDSKLLELEKRIEQSRYEDKIETIRREGQAQVAAVQKQLEEYAKRDIQPVAPPGVDTKMLLEFMQKSDERFNVLVKEMHNQKLDEITRKLDAVQNSPRKQGNDLKESMETVKGLADLMGWKTGRDDDDDEEVEEDDRDKTLVEKIVDKIIPRVIGLFEEGKQDSTRNRDEVIAVAADRAAKEEVARIRSQQQQPVARLQQMPPVPQALPPAPVVAAVSQTAATAPQLTLVPPVAPEMPKIPTIQEEIALRAGQFMEILSREMELRPLEWNWTVVAWKGLPEVLREKVCIASDPVGLISVFDGMLKPEALEGLKAKLAAEPKVSAWVGRGLSELREWGVELEKDPNFDPFTEEEGEEEGT